jgi:hypothetical protein
VTYNGKTVTIPDFAEPCLRHMTSSDVFAVADLPDVIDDAGKLVLTRRLLEEGFLTIKRPRDVSAIRTGV